MVIDPDDEWRDDAEAAALIEATRGAPDPLLDEAVELLREIYDEGEIRGRLERIESVLAKYEGRG